MQTLESNEYKYNNSIIIDSKIYEIFRQLLIKQKVVFNL